MAKPAGPGVGSAFTPGAPAESVSYAPAAPAAAAGASYLQSVANPAAGVGSQTSKKSYSPSSVAKWMAKPAGPGIGSSYTPGAPLESVSYAPVASTPAAAAAGAAVSYTHLTPPTTSSAQISVLAVSLEKAPSPHPPPATGLGSSV